MEKMEMLKIKNVLVDRLLCDKCGEPMKWDGVAYTTYPPQYPYSYPNCNSQEVTVNKTYPIYYLELSDGTMLQL